MIRKRNGQLVPYDYNKIKSTIEKAFIAAGYNSIPKHMISEFEEIYGKENNTVDMTVEYVQDSIEHVLCDFQFFDVFKEFVIYREKKKQLRNFVSDKIEFINKYKESDNTANATVDDNSNVSCRNIGVLNSEIHKEDNIEINRGMIMSKLRELYPEFNAKQYLDDLNNHIIYKHDESSFAGAISPYCCSITMYPFLTNGIKGIGGLSAAPKNLDSFCGMFINLVFATSAQFAGAVATSEFLMYFDYFARKEWGYDYYIDPLKTITANSNRIKTIEDQIHQYFQQVV